MMTYTLDWKVLDESSMSDHKYIKFYLNTPKQNIIEVRPSNKLTGHSSPRNLNYPGKKNPPTGTTSL